MPPSSPTGSASEPCTALEDYKETSRSAFVPSLFTALHLAGTIALVYGILLRSYTEAAAGAAVLLGSYLTLPKIIGNSIARDGGPHPQSGPRELNQSVSFRARRPFLPAHRRTMGVIIVSVALSLLTAFRICSLLPRYSPGPHPPPARWKVERLEPRRYHLEALLVAGPAGPGPLSHRGIRALGRFSATAPLREGDEIDLRSAPARTTEDRGDLQAYDRLLLRHGVRFIFYPGEDEYTRVRRAAPSLRTAAAGTLKEAIDRLFSASASPLVKALYFGDSSMVDKITLSNFKRAGVLHILAASGFNVGLVAAIPLLLAPFSIDRRILYSVAVALAWAYLFITNVPVSLLRATLMFSVFALQRITDLERNILNALFISAAAILCLSPYELYSLGFQLSYGATFGIIVFYGRFRAALPIIPSFLSNSLALTLSAQVLVFPIIFISLREVNLTGIIANLLLVPGMSMLFLLSLIPLALLPFADAAAAAVASFPDLCAQANLYLAGVFSGLNGHFAVTERVWMLPAPYLLLLVPLLPLRQSVRKKGSVAVACAFLLAWLPLSQGGRPVESIKVFRTASSAVVVRTGGSLPLIYGSLGHSEDTRMVLAFIQRPGSERFCIFVPVADGKNLFHFGRIAKASVVTRCVIDSGFRLSAPLRRFCALLERDGVGLEISPLPRLTNDDLAQPENFLARVESRGLFLPPPGRGPRAGGFTRPGDLTGAAQSALFSLRRAFRNIRPSIQ